jgi:NADH-quinone oxidoreductase subunit M
MKDWPILSLLIIVPLLGVLVIMLGSVVKKKTIDDFSRSVALFFSLINFGLGLGMWWMFDSSAEGMQFVERSPWMEGYNIYYYLGIDGISLFFVLLTTFLVPICIIVSWNSIKKRLRDYMLLFLLLESLVIGAFTALDLILFYLFFEAVLIPMFFIIGIWGGDNRVYASYKFFLYTLFGSLFFLLGVIYIYLQSGTTDIIELQYVLPTYEMTAQKMLWLAFFTSFAIKVPMWPLHTWLPDAHVQAPTAGSVILAGILLKLGGYGFLRFSLPMLPDASHYYSNMVMILSIIAVIYTSLVALMQEDMKKLIAYSSVAHMGYVTAGIFSFKTQGVEGAVFQMISHGLVSAALFLCVGVLYDRMKTKEIAFYNGLTSKMPAFAVVFMIFTLASAGLPGTAGFVGEFMVLLGVFSVNKLYSALLALAMVLGAAYMLWLYARIMFGESNNKKLSHIPDLTWLERGAFWPIVILIILIGVYPKLVLADVTQSVTRVVEKVASVSEAAINNATDTIEEEEEAGGEAEAEAEAEAESTTDEIEDQ